MTPVTVIKMFFFLALVCPQRCGLRHCDRPQADQAQGPDGQRPKVEITHMISTLGPLGEVVFFGADGGTGGWEPRDVGGGKRGGDTSTVG